VAILLAGGVLLGFMALVVDVGLIYVEREELQTGADAAVLAVAKACATDADQCTDSLVDGLVPLAQSYANANSPDGVSNVVDVCGRLPGVLLECGAPNSNRTDCLGSAPPEPAPYVEVRLGTELPGNRLVLPPVFAQAMAGNAGYDGAAVAACARATWVPGPDVPILAMTVSTCEFGEATENGTTFGLEYAIRFLSGSFQGPCPDPDDSFGAPREAAFLDGGGPNCERTMPADGVVNGEYVLSSTEPSPTCANRLDQALAASEVVLIPVHDGVDHPSSGLVFRHIHLAPFVVTGYTLGPPPGTPPAGLCASDEWCISGLFVGSPVPLSGLAGDSIVKLIG